MTEFSVKPSTERTFEYLTSVHKEISKCETRTREAREELKNFYSQDMDDYDTLSYEAWTYAYVCELEELSALHEIAREITEYLLRKEDGFVYTIFNK